MNVENSSKKKTFQLQFDGKQYSITTSNVVNKMEKKTIRECKKQKWNQSKFFPKNFQTIFSSAFYNLAPRHY